MKLLLMIRMISELKNAQPTMARSATVRFKLVMIRVPVLREAKPQNDETDGSFILILV